MNELITIYRYDGTTKLYNGETSAPSMENINIDDANYTTSPIPDYDIDYSELKYDAVADDWDIVDLPSPLMYVKNKAIAGINDAFTQALKSNLTLTAETAGLYQLKYAEAIKYIDANSPASLANYPFLKLESDVLNVSATTVAETIITAHDAWNAKLLNIETIRQTSKAEIEGIAVSDTAKTTIEQISETAIDEILNLL